MLIENNPQINQKIENLKKAMKAIGFAQSEIDSQLEKLSQLMLANFAKKITEEKFQGNQPSPKQFQEMIQKMTPEENRQFVAEAITPIFAEYITAITQDLDEDKKQQFSNLLNS